MGFIYALGRTIYRVSRPWWQRIAPSSVNHTAISPTIRLWKLTTASKPPPLPEMPALPYEMDRRSCKTTSTPPVPKPPLRTVKRRPCLGNRGSPWLIARLMALTKFAANATQDSYAIMGDSPLISNGYPLAILNVSEG